MRTLLLVAILGLAARPADADWFESVKVGGSVNFQADSARNISDFSTNRENQAAGASNNDRLGTAMLRTIAWLRWDLPLEGRSVSEAHAKITLRKNDKAWGTAGAAGQQAGGSQAFGAPAAGGVQSNTFVQEATVKLDKVFGAFDTTLGRQFWGEAGDLIAFWGAKDAYGLPVTAIDALSIASAGETLFLEGLAGKTTGSAIGALTGPDVDVNGLQFGAKGRAGRLAAFVWRRVTHGTGALATPPTNGVAATGRNDYLWVTGLKYRAAYGGAWVNLTAAANFGENRLQTASACTGAGGCPAKSGNYLGRGGVLMAGYKLDAPGTVAVAPWVTWGWGSGRHDSRQKRNEDFQTIASDFRPGEIYGRFNTAGLVNLGANLNNAGTFTGPDGQGGVATPGLTNRIIWGAGMVITPSRWTENLRLSASFWDFSYQKSTRNTQTTGPQAAGNRHIGSEIDASVEWVHNKRVSLRGGWATVQPGGFIKETVRDKLSQAASGHITGVANPGVQEGVRPVTLFFSEVNVRF